MVGTKKIYKSIVKYLKPRQKRLKRYGVPIIGAIIIFTLGVSVQIIRQNQTHPKNLVWGIESSVKVPRDLRNMLMKRNDCVDYRGYESELGVGLWAVVQTEQDSFAKITHGCSWALNNQALAVKNDNKWALIPSKEYFSDTVQGTPSCSALVKHKVPAKLEGFCMNDSGKLSKNPNP